MLLIYIVAVQVCSVMGQSLGSVPCVGQVGVECLLINVELHCDHAWLPEIRFIVTVTGNPLP